MIADVAVATGISPRELLALDADAFDELVLALERKWTRELELAATTLEVAHAHFLAFLRVHSKRGARLPDPLRVDRPGAKEAEKEARANAPVVSIAEVARMNPRATREVQR